MRSHAAGRELRSRVLGPLPVVNHLLARPPATTRPSWAFSPTTWRWSTTTGSAGCWRRCSAPTGPACSPRWCWPPSREFDVDTSEVHNDSTSVSFTGDYGGATGTPRGGQPTPAITHGHSKDHRPDLKQLVLILTVAGDGAVPLAFRVADHPHP
jgi:hypothetical protein